MQTSTASHSGFVSVASRSSVAPHTLLRLSAALGLFLAPLVSAQVPADMVLVDSAGRSIHIGALTDDASIITETPRRLVIFTRSFHLGETEVTYDTWSHVRNWALTNGYPSLPAGQNGAVATGTTHPGRPTGTVAERLHPVTRIHWYDAVIWCNARSEMEGLTPCYTLRNGGGVIRSVPDWLTELDCNWAADGYRLPTSAEWEYAARGGVDDGRRFPWGEFITHDNASYRSNFDAASTFAYDQSPTTGCHPLWNGTAPAGTFPTTGFGLHEMSGNVSEWVWDWEPLDWHHPYVGLPDPDIDPRGPVSGTVFSSGWIGKAARGGDYYESAVLARAAALFFPRVSDNSTFRGFRVARSVPATAPRFAIAPVDREGSFGGTTSFSIVVGGAPTPAVRWQRAPAGSDVFTDLSEGGNHTGVATATLTVALVSGNQHGDRFRCIATNNSGSATSDAATLTLTGIPATMTLGALSCVYDGQPKSATATTSPDGLTVVLTYNGSATPPTAAGAYSVIGTINDANYVGSATGTLTILPLVVLAHPATVATTAGGSTTLSVAVQCGGAATCQWQVLRQAGSSTASAVTETWDDIPGATGASFTIPSAQRFHGGSYRAVVSAGGVSTSSEPVTLSVEVAAPSASRLLNLSTRALCLTGDDVIIPGFVISGSGSKRLLMRAVGPELAPFDVVNLPDPQMTLTRWDGSAYLVQTTNDNWGDNTDAAAISAAGDLVHAFPLESGSLSSALLLDLEPGQYTLITSDTGSRTGVSLVELYDVDPASSATRLINISNRGYVGTGNDLMIPGFVVSEEGPKTFLIRAIGPKLADFGVRGVLADPQLRIYRRLIGTETDESILTNDNWGENGDAATTAAVAAQVWAQPLPAGSKDAAFVVMLTPAIYTVHASGVDGDTGVALVEVYVVE